MNHASNHASNHVRHPHCFKCGGCGTKIGQKWTCLYCRRW